MYVVAMVYKLLNHINQAYVYLLSKHQYTTRTDNTLRCCYVLPLSEIRLI